MTSFGRSMCLAGGSQSLLIRNCSMVGPRKAVRAQRLKPIVDAVSSNANGSSGGGGGSVRRITNRDLDALRKVFGPRPAPDGPDQQESTSYRPGEQPFFPPTDISATADPSISVAIANANDWRELKDLYGTVARRIEPGQLMAMTQRLAHVTGVLVWPEGAPLPEPPLPGSPGPLLSEADVEEVVSLAGNLCRATQVCMPDMYGMQQVAGMLQAFVALGCVPASGWLKAAEVVVLRTQQQSAETGSEVASTLINELLLIAGAFQRLAHTPDRSFINLLASVRPLEEVQRHGAASVAAGVTEVGEVPGAGAVMGGGGGDPLLVVLTAPQLVVMARAVLLWGLQPPTEWPEAFLQAIYTRISRANELAATVAAGRPLSSDEALEAAEASEALEVGGLATLVWAAAVLEARPADPGGQWHREVCNAALRHMQDGLQQQPAELVGVPESSGSSSSGGGGRPYTGPGLQDLASLLSALQLMRHDPGRNWMATFLQTAAAAQSTTDPSPAATPETLGGLPPGDALAGVLFLAAQYDHAQDESTREYVVSMAIGAQQWMQLQPAQLANANAASKINGADAGAAASSASDSAASSAFGSSSPTSSWSPPPAVVFSGRGLTQLLMGLVRMGGEPSEAWLRDWVAAAEPLADRALSASDMGFDLDQVLAVLATCSSLGITMPENLALTMAGTALLPALAPSPQQQGAAGAGAGGQPTIASGPGTFLPSGVVDAASIAAAATGNASGSSGRGGGAPRDLSYLRSVLELVQLLQPYKLLPGWLEYFAGLVEDFRLRLSGREILAVVVALGAFRDVRLAPLAPPATSSSRPSATTGPAPPPSSPSPKASPSPSSSSGASRNVGAGSTPIVARAPLLLPVAAATANPAAAPVLLDTAWMRGLLDDLRLKSGVGGPSDLLQLAQTLSDLQAPPQLLSYIEVFAVGMTGEEGRRRVAPGSRPPPPAPWSKAAAKPSPIASSSPASASGAATEAKPGSSARIRLRLQKGAVERATALTATAPPSTAGAAGAADSEARAAEEEAELWSLAWPAMLGAFAAGRHVPQKSWWVRFASATSSQLDSYEPARLVATATAALGLSHQYAAAGGVTAAGSAAGPDSLLPSIAWHEEAFSRVADLLQSCPMGMDQVREQAVLVLSEQRRLQEETAASTSTPTTTTPTSNATSGTAGANGDVSNQEPAGPTQQGGDELLFGEEEFRSACLEVSSWLPGMLTRLLEPRVALPPPLMVVLEQVVGQVAATAESAARRLGALGGSGEGGNRAGELATGRAARAGSTGAAGRRRDGRGAAAEGLGPSGVEKEEVEAEEAMEALMYAQQVLALVMQIFLVSEHLIPEALLRSVLDVMLVSRPIWGQGSETGELQFQQQLLLSPDQLTTLAYMAGRQGAELTEEQVALLLSNAARLAASGQLSAGPLAAALSGLSGINGVEVVEQGPREVELMMETLASQATRLSAEGLGEAATALLQLGVGLPPEMSMRFRPAVVACAAEFTPQQMLAVLAAGSSLGLEPPSRELLTALSQQVGRLASHPDQLAPAAATEAAYEVLRWFPQVAPADSELYIGRLRAGLKGLLDRLDEIASPSAAKLALLLATVGLPSRLSSPGSPEDEQRAAELEPLVAAAGEGLDEYDIEQLSNAIMGLSLLGLKLPRDWMERFQEASRPHLSTADGRSLAYLLAGLADQQQQHSAEPMDARYVVTFWAAVRQQAAAPEYGFDLLSARTLLESAGQLRLRPDRDTLQAVLDCALLQYRSAPDPSGLAELVQVMASLNYVPNPAWATEARSALATSLSSISPEAAAAAVAFLRAAMPQAMAG